MKYIVTAEEMKRADAYTMNTIGIPSLVLMERAALKTVEALHTEQFCLDKVLVVCGVGNNGGDGMAVARLLFLEGVDVTACVVGNREKASDQAAQQLHILEFYERAHDRGSDGSGLYDVGGCSVWRRSFPGRWRCLRGCSGGYQCHAGSGGWRWISLPACTPIRRRPWAAPCRRTHRWPLPLPRPGSCCIRAHRIRENSSWRTSASRRLFLRESCRKCA